MDAYAAPVAGRPLVPTIIGTFAEAGPDGDGTHTQGGHHPLRPAAPPERRGAGPGKKIAVVGTGGPATWPSSSNGFLLGHRHHRFVIDTATLTCPTYTP